ncbi:MAG: hypothetical protein C4327_07930 [Meiothermus sp.]
MWELMLVLVVPLALIVLAERWLREIFSESSLRVYDESFSKEKDLRRFGMRRELKDELPQA